MDSENIKQESGLQQSLLEDEPVEQLIEDKPVETIDELDDDEEEKLEGVKMEEVGDDNAEIEEGVKVEDANDDGDNNDDNDDDESGNEFKDEVESEEEKIDEIDSKSSNGDLEEDISKLNKFKKSGSDGVTSSPSKKRSKDEIDDDIDQTEEIEDEQTRKRREFEEKFNALLKKPTKKRKNNDVDLEAMQDEAISHLKNMMKDAAYMDIDCVNNKKPATNKLKLLPQVKDTLLKSNLYDSILDNNMLEAVRIWLEPLPDASLPSFEIQKTLLTELGKMPIKTIHLRESGLGKVMLFYQKSKKVDSSLKRIAEKLIGDWTRPVMGRSDNYRAREVPTANFDIEKFRAKTKLQSADDERNKTTRKSLYQESADRRKRAAAPEVRTSVYTIAPQTNVAALHSRKASVLSMGIGASLNRDERFKTINKKLTKLSQKKKAVKKGGVSIEGRGLNV